MTKGLDSPSDEQNWKDNSQCGASNRQEKKDNEWGSTVDGRRAHQLVSQRDGKAKGEAVQVTSVKILPTQGR